MKTLHQRDGGADARTSGRENPGHDDVELAEVLDLAYAGADIPSPPPPIVGDVAAAHSASSPSASAVT